MNPHSRRFTDLGPDPLTYFLEIPVDADAMIWHFHPEVSCLEDVYPRLRPVDKLSLFVEEVLEDEDGDLFVSYAPIFVVPGTVQYMAVFEVCLDVGDPQGGDFPPCAFVADIYIDGAGEHVVVEPQDFVEYDGGLRMYHGAWEGDRAIVVMYFDRATESDAARVRAGLDAEGNIEFPRLVKLLQFYAEDPYFDLSIISLDSEETERVIESIP